MEQSYCCIKYYSILVCHEIALITSRFAELRALWNIFETHYPVCGANQLCGRDIHDASIFDLVRFSRFRGFVILCVES